jgi:hypothetical protein
MFVAPPAESTLRGLHWRSLLRVITYGDSPAHKHSFDQFRFAYQGDFSIAENMTIREDELCYHPEGVECRPQVDEEDGTDHILVILPLGGTCGQGYLSYD